MADISESPDALAALAALQSRKQRDLGNSELESIDIDPLLEQCMQDGVVDCLLSMETMERAVPSALQQQLTEAWRASASRRMRQNLGLTLRIEAPAQLIERRTQRLLSAAAHAGSICFDNSRLLRPPLASRRNLAWPLRIGFMPEPESLKLKSGLMPAFQSAPFSDFFDIVELGAAGGECDILCLPLAGEAEALGLHAGIRANAVLALESEPAEIRGAALQRLPALFQAGAAAIVQQLDDPRFFRRFIEGLAHDLPFDAALGRAAREPDSYLISAGREWLDASKLGTYLRQPGARHGPRLMRAIAGMEPGRLAVEPRASTRSAFRSAAAQPRMAAAESPGEPPPGEDRPAEPRWLHAEVHALLGGEAVKLKQAFFPSEKHRLSLYIAPGEHDSIRLDVPFEEIPFPAGTDFLELDVVVGFSGKGIKIPTLARRIKLRRKGRSDTAVFEFTVPRTAKKLAAAITVFHNGRYVQGGVLSGLVAAPGTATPGEIDFRRQAASQSESALQTPAQLVLRKEDDKVTVCFGESCYSVDLKGIAAVKDVIRDHLYDAATRPNLKKGGLQSDAGMNLLRFLAVQGAVLRKKLFDGRGVELKDVKVVEVLSSHSADTFPAEFLYDLDSPGHDAGLCPCFLAAGDGTSCKARSAPRKWVCPSAFWSINRVIGHEAPPLKTVVMPGPTRERPALPKLRNVILAASDRVNEEHPTATADMLEASRAVASITQVRSWEGWVEAIRKTRPGLLVALPHNEWLEPLAMEALEIGVNDQLRYDLVGPEHVCFPEKSDPPVVLLLGCTTAAAKVSFHDFVGAIRGGGAAVVVGTIARVLGHHAAPVAQELIIELCKQGGNATFGEVMKGVRASMLRNGNVMSLALACFGDIDWKFE